MKFIKNIAIITALMVSCAPVAAINIQEKVTNLKNTLLTAWQNKKVKAVVAGGGALGILAVGYLAHKRHQQEMLPFTQYPVAQQVRGSYKKSGWIKIQDLISSGLAPDTASNYTAEAYFGTLDFNVKRHLDFLITNKVLVPGRYAASSYEIKDTGMMLSYINWVRNSWNSVDDASNTQKDMLKQAAESQARALEKLLEPLKNEK